MNYSPLITCPQAGAFLDAMAAASNVGAYVSDMVLPTMGVKISYDPDNQYIYLFQDVEEYADMGHIWERKETWRLEDFTEQYQAWTAGRQIGRQ